MDKELKLSKSIRKIRNSLGFSQGYVAKKLNVTQQAYSHMENAPHKVSIERLSEICTVFKIDLLTLLTDAYGKGKKTKTKVKPLGFQIMDKSTQEELIQSLQQIQEKLDALKKHNKE